MFIVIDTNILFKNFRLNNISSQLVLNHLDQTQHTFCIPEVVYLETINKFKEELRNEIVKTRKGLQSIHKLTDVWHQIRDSDFANVDKAVKDYENYLIELAQRFNRIKLNFPLIPNIKHEEIVNRAIKKEKPFSESGRGYRDTLIWINILELATSSGEKIAFISENINDFADKKNEKSFHSDLIKELSDKQLQDKVLYYPSIHLFFDQCILPSLPQIEQTIAKFLKATKEYSFFEDALLDFLCEKLMFNDRVDLGREFEDTSIDEIYEILKWEIIKEIEMKEEGKRVIELEAEFECEISFCLYKSEWFAMLEEESKKIHIIDSDWNDHYIRASTNHNASLYAYLTLDMNQGVIESIDVLELY